MDLLTRAHTFRPTEQGSPMARTVFLPHFEICLRCLVHTCQLPYCQYPEGLDPSCRLYRAGDLDGISSCSVYA